MEKIAETYGVQEALVEQKDATFEQSPKDSDVDYIKGRGKLVVGVTDFEPVDYKVKMETGSGLMQMWQNLSEKNLV